MLWIVLSGKVDMRAATQHVDLSQAVVVVSPGNRGQAEKMAATILVEEVAKRTGIGLIVQQAWPPFAQPVIAIATRASKNPWSDRVPHSVGETLSQARPEGYAIQIADGKDDGPPSVFVVGADSRGAMFGVGRLLRALQCGAGEIKLDASFEVATAPEYSARGHELGYRAQANTYDAWSREQYDQYIREQILFGMNCVQNIPFQDTRASQWMQLSRHEMNRTLGEICAQYDIDYWVWTPVEFSLTDQTLRQEELKRHQVFYRSTPRLNGVFVPGGDPGDNPPELVLPFMEDLAQLLAKYHPQAKVWMSLQDFDESKVEVVMDTIARKQPDWFGGIVADTSALPINQTRRRLPRRYPVRWYPDITHTVECQFPVSWWDPAFAVTLGREPTNPRPTSYATIFRQFAPHTDGFVTYSDGINDDVNKAIWSMLGWDSRQEVREILIQYARFHFGDHVAEEAADGLLGLENNWRGSLTRNASVDGVLALWERLEEHHPELLENWRFQQHLMRAYYDAYTRHRLIYESQLEREAIQVLGQAAELGADASTRRAEKVLNRASENPCRPQLRARVDELADALFRSIGYQTSIERFGGSGAERGCVIDFVDRPLNDRWWLEDEFAKIRKFSIAQAKLSRLEIVRTWEDPGPGSFYDDVGHVGKSPRVIRGEESNTDPEGRRHEIPGHSWVDEGMSRRRLAWLHHMRWPVGIDYDGLDPDARYMVRLTGQGESPLRGDGVRLAVTVRAQQIGQFQEFSVPAELTADGTLRLTWDLVNESHLNWKMHSHVAEVWLLKQ
jgi:mannose-6-phosphate isomerase-like protein (cupin superfamily)